ncbi:unnamed protein product [Caenorhabditis bovis]|uniref:BZIP domain-containing protein n=1 Tax=Caenorhabditis bovis TaxID=2654633 RepID=A0A8S1EG67_9PELO|nr:unnamed protein product [Caenorhabditis bovis]
MDLDDINPTIDTLVSATYSRFSDFDEENLYNLEFSQDSLSSSNQLPSSSTDSSPPLSINFNSGTDLESWDGNTYDDYAFNSAFSLNYDNELEEQKVFARIPQPVAQRAPRPTPPNPKNLIGIKTLVPVTPKQTVRKLSAEQNRKIKNRMYAQASRQRKKNEETEMRNKIDELQKENQQLREENCELRNRLSRYEYVEQETPQRAPTTQPLASAPPTKRKLVAAGTFLLAFGIIAVISPFSLGGHDPNIHRVSNEYLLQSTSHGRVLPDSVGEVSTNSNSSVHSDCSFKMNASEALRVKNDIDQWVRVHSFKEFDAPTLPKQLFNKDAMERFNKDGKLTKVKLQKSAVQDSAEIEPVKRSKYRSRQRTWKQLDLLRPDLSMHNRENIRMKKKQIEKLGTMIRQKSDTLYIVALQDYILLPALKRSTTSAPKVSIVLPSYPINGTMLDEYSLLRVECEVTGTGQLTISSGQLSALLP